MFVLTQLELRLRTDLRLVRDRDDVINMNPWGFFEHTHVSFAPGVDARVDPCHVIKGYFSVINVIWSVLSLDKFAVLTP